VRALRRHRHPGRGRTYAVHGYYYRILTQQGPNAPGGTLSYVVKGKMIGGFALVAYPAEYGNSGVMTFLVNHSGTVYQKDLGDYTMTLVRRMMWFDPGQTWKMVNWRRAAPMGRHSAGLTLLILLICSGLAAPSHAQAPGYVRVVFAKAGLIVGAGGGRGVLTYRGHDYPFRVSGLSLGVTIGASALRFTGRVSGLREVRDFAGTYDAVGGGGAFIGGVSGVQLTNKKGVMISLQGVEAGMEFAANRSGIRISLR
jgi:hypothetical protein